MAGHGTRTTVYRLSAAHVVGGKVDKLWKATERALAQRLGGERVPITGRIRGSAPDIAHNWLSVEVKTRRRLPLWLLEAVEQAVVAAKGTQLPIAILHENHKYHDSDLVVMRLKDWEDWFGGESESAQNR